MGCSLILASPPFSSTGPSGDSASFATGRWTCECLRETESPRRSSSITLRSMSLQEFSGTSERSERSKEGKHQDDGPARSHCRTSLTTGRPEDSPRNPDFPGNQDRYQQGARTPSPRSPRPRPDGQAWGAGGGSQLPFPGGPDREGKLPRTSPRRYLSLGVAESIGAGRRGNRQQPAVPERTLTFGGT